MALRKPLVITSGQIQQLQSGDTLDAPAISGGDVVIQTNDEATPIVIGMAVYNDTNDGVKKAKADAAGTKKVLGLVSTTSIAAGATGGVMLNGVLTATTAQWDAVTGQVGGLTFGTNYYLSAATAGNLTTTAPVTVGQYVEPIGIAISTTEMDVRVLTDVLL